MSRQTFRISFGLLAATVAVMAVALPAARGQTVQELEDRMESIQDELDATTQRIEDLRTEEDGLLVKINELDARIAEIEGENSELIDRVVDRARELYMGGSVGMLDTLLSARDFSELSTELEYATRVSDSDALLFVRHSRIAQELRVIRAEAQERAEELAGVRSDLSETSDTLQERFRDAQDEYDELRERLAEEQREAAAAEAASTGSAAPAAAPAQVNAPVNADGKTCPVAGPNSFIDSWGYPRSGGRTHEGTDIMAADGTPVVAITDGTITYAGYGDSAGNWLILTGRDGHGYWYMHNRQNLVTGGSVQVGDQIATVGNTGNASGGAPHVHFEYHPGGGGPINPYPLLSQLC